MDLTDTVGYLYQMQVGVFNDPVHPAGYGLFLEAIRVVTKTVEVTIAIQHLLGLASGIALYAAVRRFGLPVWTALVAAAAILLSLDQIFLEHALMSETLFTFLLSVSLYACSRAYVPGRQLTRDFDARALWLLAAGALLALATCVRGAGLPLAFAFVLWAGLALPASGWARVRNAGLMGGAIIAVLLAYATLNHVESDRFAVSESSGWALYSRTAPFADCERFTPPSGTERLCETTAKEARLGPDHYGWDDASPARIVFGGQPNGDAELGVFARRAILAQPLDYAEAFGYDLLRYFVPDTPLVPDWVEKRDGAGPGYEITDVAGRSPEFEQVVQGNMRDFYPSATLSVSAAIDPLGELQDLVRVHPWLLLAALIAGVAGVWLTRGGPRAGLTLFLAVSVLMLVIGAATTTYTARYAIPVQGPLVAAGAIGAWALAERLRARRGSATDPDAASSA
jgi:hypothetical protein